MIKVNNRFTVYGNCISWIAKDKSLTSIYTDHYLKVLRYRENQPRTIDIDNHELIGKKFKRNGKECTIESVHKMWFFGWYLVALYYSLYETNENFCSFVINGKMYGKSHGTIYIKNINCHYPQTYNRVRFY